MLTGPLKSFHVAAERYHNVVKFLAVLWAFAAVLGAQEKPALTSPQRQKIGQIVKESEEREKTEAATVALKLADAVRKIDRNLLSETPDEAADRKTAAELDETISGLIHRVIQARLTVVRELAKVLTAEQKKVLLAEIDKPGSNPMGMQELIEKVFGKLE